MARQTSELSLDFYDSVDDEDQHYIMTRILAKSSDIPKRLYADVVIALDRSQSMKGKWRIITEGISSMIEQFSEKDRVGLITFSGSASVLFELQSMNLQNKRRFQKIIQNPAKPPAGTTNLHCGLDEGFKELSKYGRQKSQEAMLLLFTDGVPTKGITDRNQIIETVKKWLQKIPNSRLYSFGYGKKHDPVLLSSLGPYFYVQSTSKLLEATADLWAGVQITVAKNIVLTVQSQVSISVTCTYNVEDYPKDTNGNYFYRITFPDIRSEEFRTILFCVTQATGKAIFTLEYYNQLIDVPQAIRKEIIFSNLKFHSKTKDIVDSELHRYFFDYISDRLSLQANKGQFFEASTIAITAKETMESTPAPLAKHLAFEMGRNAEIFKQAHRNGKPLDASQLADITQIRQMVRSERSWSTGLRVPMYLNHKHRELSRVFHQQFQTYKAPKKQELKPPRYVIMPSKNLKNNNKLNNYIQRRYVIICDPPFPNQYAILKEGDGIEQLKYQVQKEARIIDPNCEVIAFCDENGFDIFDVISFYDLHQNENIDPNTNQGMINQMQNQWSAGGCCLFAQIISNRNLSSVIENEFPENFSPVSRHHRRSTTPPTVLASDSSPRFRSKRKSLLVNQTVMKNSPNPPYQPMCNREEVNSAIQVLVQIIPQSDILDKVLFQVSLRGPKQDQIVSLVEALGKYPDRHELLKQQITKIINDN